jgi:ubiquinone/menaquinone biosynthesis C-methylase UbiE
MLSLQADISYEYERYLFKNKYWKKANRVLDVGCGNGYYTSLLAKDYPQKSFCAIDSNEDLINMGKMAVDAKNISFISSNYKNFEQPHLFDFIIARLVVSQLADRAEFFSWLFSLLLSGGGLLLIDADDDSFYVYPELPIFNSIVRRTQKKIDSHGCRNTKRLVSDELYTFGFKQERFITLSSNSLMAEKSLFHQCMLHTLKFEAGDTLPLEAYKELFEWLIDEEAFVQYGIYAGLYYKEK